MLEDARAKFKAAVTSPSWVVALAGILPLSALIDFLDLRALHSFHLTGAVPLWCWPLTPGGSRLLLSEKHSADYCCLDEYGRSLGLRCLDGRFGDDFSASNPETLRMWLKSIKVNEFENKHPNMSIRGREQTLEVVHVERQPTQKRGRHPLRLLLASLLGWILLAGLFVLTIIMQCYWALAFLLLMPLTGASITRIHVKGPRYLNIEKSSPFNRLVVVTQHVNETNWRVFYGESTVVNALLNTPFLAKRGRVATGIELHIVQLILRFFVLGQWVVAIAAAALQGWDAYIIAFWIALSILSRTFVFSEERTVLEWVQQHANVNLSRYRITLSSRRTLLSTIIALNPDTFPLVEKSEVTDYNSWWDGALKWIDPILKDSNDRQDWLKALRLALKENAVGLDLLEVWRKDPTMWWESSIDEGIEICGELKAKLGFTGRKV
ncbi:hypothetical protein BGZ57DRAFT_776591 [Hyaloscypha finlandica]|nr:hypothetical protein BGZ57DRAFT_776591 [Hyaloscypha finlandica]